MKECPLLHRFEAIPVQHAYDFGFSRFPHRVLVDSSKRVYWADPRGWYASERRKTQAGLGELIDEWLND